VVVVGVVCGLTAVVAVVGMVLTGFWALDYHQQQLRPHMQCCQFAEVEKGSI